MADPEFALLLGLLADVVQHRSVECGCHAGTSAPRAGIGLVNHLLDRHPRREVALIRLMWLAGRVISPVLGLADQGEPWRRELFVFGVINVLGQAELDGDGQPDLFASFNHLLVFHELVRTLRAVEAEPIRLHKADEVGQIYDRDLDLAHAIHLEPVPQIARRQELSAVGPNRVTEVDRDRGTRARDALDLLVAQNPGLAVMRRDSNIDHIVEVGGVDTDGGPVPGRFHETLVDRVGADRG